MEAGPGPGPRLCCKPGGRLDMNHGFVHHIRRNQIARDNYDKKVKQAAKEKVRRRHTPAPTRPRKPDLQVYLPRHRDGSTQPSNPDYEESAESSSSGGSELEPSSHQLFCLEYEADSGEVTSVIVYQTHLTPWTEAGMGRPVRRASPKSRCWPVQAGKRARRRREASMCTMTIPGRVGRLAGLAPEIPASQRFPCGNGVDRASWHLGVRAVPRPQSSAPGSSEVGTPPTCPRDAGAGAREL
ncbi:UPF0561 protein C2orf68 homolog isoform X1 [Lemur catta]|uniref:UPF0561 protein C2orf68 homolog isoform X1 n=1 Tax=Lemur catta TaxID=9447 RepID=UPI001E269263|nr:UPF0561 protein C2orf68 homolog isoform X1 [Lemur catta]